MINLPVIAAIFVGYVIGALLHKFICSCARRHGEVILEYSFDWLPTDATIPCKVSHAQRFKLDEPYMIAFDHPPVTPVKVTIHDQVNMSDIEFCMDVRCKDGRCVGSGSCGKTKTDSQVGQA